MEAPGTPSPLEERVQQLAEELAALASRVRRLEEGGPVLTAEGVALTAPPETILAEEGPAPSALSLGRVSTLLSGAATVCFLLVVALILRTLAENRVLPLYGGSLLGIAYAAALTAWGWTLGFRGHRRATIFTLTGTLLLATVVLEAHARFHVVGTPAAYLLLAGASVGAAVVGGVRGRPLPTAVVALVALGAGSALDFPNPDFPQLALFVLVIDGVAYGAMRPARYTWIRAVALMATLAVWGAWGLRLNRAVYQVGGLADVPNGYWFLPLVALFALFFLGTSYRQAAGCREGRLGIFDAVLPTLTVAWTFGAAIMAVAATPGGPEAVGGVAVAVAAAAFGTGALLVRGNRDVPAGTGAFAFAGFSLLLLGLPEATGSLPVTLPVAVAVGLGLCLLSERWRSGGVRVTAYLGSPAACLYGVLGGAFAAGGPSALVPACAAGTLAGLAFAQYRWCRRHPPPGNSVFFGSLDKTDDTAVVFLLVSLLAGFMAVRVGAYVVLALWMPDLANAFGCTQSMIINLSALGLMYTAFRARNSELRGVAILVIAVGALKVLVYDLLGAHGVPLVLSVFTFGVAAALVAMLLGRWQQPEGPRELS